jgi:tetratricopeptide (TPR) repeat protein
MTATSQRAQPAPPPLTEAVRALYLERRSGVLEVAADSSEPAESEASKRRFFFVDGELHLAPVHEVARKLAPHLPLWPDRPSRSPVPSAWMTGAKVEVKELMVRIARLIRAWSGSTYTFFEGRQTLPPDLVGPLPTAFLLMEWAVVGRTDVELLADLGGPRVQLVAAGGGIPPSVAAVLEPQESLLVSRLAEQVPVGELLRQAGGDGPAVLHRLARLRSVGLVRFLREPEVLQRGALVPAEVLHRLADRVERELTVRPLDREPEVHRAQLADLLARAGGLTHYELLGIGEEATGDDVYEAYERLARLVHPCHAERLQLSGREGALWLLFERATDAYLTLSSPERRRRYEGKMGAGHDPTPSREVREREAERLARGYYQRAIVLLETEEYHFAVELLRQAVQAHPQAEYFLRLAEAQAKNPNWVRQAVDSYQKAIALGGDDPRVRTALGRLLETLGQLDQARHEYKAALEGMPADPEALAGLARIAAAAKPERRRRRGLFDFLRRG